MIDILSKLKSAIGIGILVLLAACGRGIDGSPSPVPVTGVTLNMTSFGLLVGATQKMTASVKPANATRPAVTWSSSNEAVATVNASGTVTAVALGTASISARTIDGGFVASAVVTVSGRTVPVSGISVTPASLNLVPGASEPLVVNVQPADATNASVTWHSDNPAVATVNSAGIVTAVAPGTTRVAAQTADGDYTADVAVVVSSIAPATFRIGGTLNGLSGGTLALLNNGNADTLNLMQNGVFTFANKVSSYNVTVGTQPVGFQWCAVTNGSGTATTDVTQVAVECGTAAARTTTLAGTAGTSGSADGTGAAASFSYPTGITVDSAGSLYVADTMNSTIRKITPGGVVTTLAGTAGVKGSADGTGAAASFYRPGSITVDKAGNLYVTDTGNVTIRKITPGGVVTTLAGTAGVYGSADGTGAAASFTNLSGITVDSAGNLYVTDNEMVRKITPGGGVTTLAGTAGVYGSADGTGAAASFSSPNGITVDSAGNLYVVDFGGPTIRKITPDGVVTTLAGTAGVNGSADGVGAAASFNGPGGIAIDSAGNLYVNDSNNFTIRKITPGGVVTTLAGTAGIRGSADGIGAAASFSLAWGITVDSAGNLYVADTRNNSIIRKIMPVAP
ncbi:Ig-like domain-containing protein [Burkholderia sp. BCC0322]|uniref:Ig-like domain-containing protein n=1 Tax=unclassified Burkholderia TaxID=2613784 RepID=UPI00158E2073|nr:Ig-like domain-containing protein [Burkholderia sp. BCC0322]